MSGLHWTSKRALVNAVLVAALVAQCAVENAIAMELGSAIHESGSGYLFEQRNGDGNVSGQPSAIRTHSQAQRTIQKKYRRTSQERQHIRDVECDDEQPGELSKSAFAEKQTAQGDVEKTRSRKGSLRRSANFCKVDPFDTSDDLYRFTLATYPGFEHLKQYKPDYLDNPKDALVKTSKENSLEIIGNLDKLPPGRYVEYENGFLPFAVRKFQEKVKEYPLQKQGWKIHISALPHSALKIAKLVLEVIDQNDDIFPNSSMLTYFKIIDAVPSMRTMFYLIGNLKGDGRETQAGKFMTIYPANKKHAEALVRRIDARFQKAKEELELDDNDFYPLKYEAQIGKTGWVYIRYGNMSRPRDAINPIAYVEPQQIEVTIKKGLRRTSTTVQAEESGHLTDRSTLVDDDRYHPWPDFMNKNNDNWEGARNRFSSELDLRWRAPNGTWIRWDSRPKFWAVLDL